jgi:dihydrofolate synthase / folylpolyglutamate synthase
VNITGIKTPIVCPGDSIFEILDKYITILDDSSIVAITSKIISICQNRIVPIDKISSKYALVKQEAEAYLAESDACYDAHLTIKQSRIIPSAGIDESNGNGYYVFYPEKIQETTEEIWHYLRKKHQLQNIGVIFTDSHIIPLRRGVTGTSISWCGFEPLYDYVGKKDLFNTTLRMTKINLLDALATAAVLIMGEGTEQTPMAIIKNAPKISFVERIPTTQEKESIIIPLEEDLFAPLLRNVQWIYNT